MLSEKIVFALNNVDDSYLEEAEELLDKPIASRHAFNKRTLHVLLIAAVLAAESEGKTPSVQLISTFRNGRFADVYFSISPITREEAWDAIGWEQKNAIYVIASNFRELDDAYRKIGKGTEKGLYGRYPILPPIQEDEYLRTHETREELLEKYYDADTQSLMQQTGLYECKDHRTCFSGNVNG